MMPCWPRLSRRLTGFFLLSPAGRLEWDGARVPHGRLVVNNCPVPLPGDPKSRKAVTVSEPAPLITSACVSMRRHSPSAQRPSTVDFIFRFTYGGASEDVHHKQQ